MKSRALLPLVPALAFLLFAFSASAWTKFSPGVQYPLGGPKIRLALNETCTDCESGSYAIDYFSTLNVDCAGSCDVQLVCRAYGNAHDTIILSMQPTDESRQSEIPDGPCESAYFQIKGCTPTATSPVCKVTAWLF